MRRHSKSRISVALALVLASCLVGFGPKTLISMIAPQRYRVATTITLEVDGRRLDQAFVNGCTISDQSDSIARTVQKYVHGDVPALRLPDGSVLVLKDLQPCRWETRSSRLQPIDLLDQKGFGRTARALLFDDFESAWYADEFDLKAFAGGDARLQIVNAKLMQTRAKLTRGLGETVLGLEEGSGTYSTGTGGTLEKGSWVGVRARSYRLENGAICAGYAGSGPLVLSGAEGCGRLRDCGPLVSSHPCARLEGGLRVRPEDGFRRMDVQVSQPEFAYRGRLYDSRRPEFRQPLREEHEHRTWVPRICIDEACATPSGPLWKVLFVYPDEKRLIEVAVHHEAMTRETFRTRS